MLSLLALSALPPSQRVGAICPHPFSILHFWHSSTVAIKRICTICTHPMIANKLTSIWSGAVSQNGRINHMALNESTITEDWLLKFEDGLFVVHCLELDIVSDWMIRKMPSVLATSVWFFPSFEAILSCRQNIGNSVPAIQLSFFHSITRYLESRDLSLSVAVSFNEAGAVKPRKIASLQPVWIAGFFMAFASGHYSYSNFCFLSNHSSSPHDKIVRFSKSL